MIITELYNVMERHWIDHFVFARNELNNKKGLISKIQNKKWYNEHYFIAEAITESGTILDPSCGTGALLYSLSKWSKCQLVPYGCDVDPFAIEQSNLLYGFYKPNFKLGNFTDSHIHFPRCTYSYFNIFTNMYFDIFKDFEWIKKLTELTERRLIVGIYNDVPEKDILLKIKRLEKIVIDLGFNPAVQLKGNRRKDYEAYFFDRIK